MILQRNNFERNVNLNYTNTFTKSHVYVCVAEVSFQKAEKEEQISYHTTSACQYFIAL